MRLGHLITAVLLGLLSSVAPATAGRPGAAASLRVESPETPVRLLRLAGPLAEGRAELSGLAWHGDELVLLPQFPSRFGGRLFAIAGSELRATVDGARRGALEPVPIATNCGELAARIEGFEGFEAIAFRGDDAYVLVETARAGTTAGVLVRGRFDVAARKIELDVASAVSLAPQVDLDNMGYEALVVAGDDVLALTEVNADANVAPRALRFGPRLEARAPLPVAPLAYRVTDATAPDGRGRFWVSNVFWPGEAWRPAPCPLFERFGRGKTHGAGRGVERLVELALDATGIHPTGRRPLQLALAAGCTRNWEGVARLEGRGFLLVTDEHPETLLGFLPAP